MLTKNKKSWSYLAGLVDGEGSITISDSTDPETGYAHYKFDLTVYNSSEEVMRWLIANFGGSYRPGSKKGRKDNWATVFRWYPTGRQNKIECLLGIIPYLSIKKEQAKFGLKYLNIPLMANCKNLRKEYARKMSELNQSLDRPIKKTGKGRDSYVAALIDGEGTIGIYRNSWNNSFQVALRISNKQLSLMKWLDKFYGGVYRIYQREGKDPEYSWEIYGPEATELISTVSPYLNISYKKEQARLASQFYDDDFDRDFAYKYFVSQATTPHRRIR